MEYKYTCEPGHTEWTPMNSNLHMQSIKVREEEEVLVRLPCETI